MIKFVTYLQSRITNVGGILAGATEVDITTADGAKLPDISAAADYMYASLKDAVGNKETIKISSVSTDTLTIVRAQDGTTARAFSADDIVDFVIVNASFVAIQTEGSTASTALRTEFEIEHTATTGLHKTVSITSTATADTLIDVIANGVFDSDQHAMSLVSNAVQINSALATIEYLNSSSTASLFRTINAGTGHGYVHTQSGVLASGKHGLYEFTAAIQINDSLAKFASTHASSTANVVEVDNYGTGNGVIVNVLGNVAADNMGVKIATAVAQTVASSALFQVIGSNVGSTADMSYFFNSGSGTNVRIYQRTETDALKYGAHILTDVAQTNSELLYVASTHVGSTKAVGRIVNYGSGTAFAISSAITASTGFDVAINSASNSIARFTNDGNNQNRYGIAIIAGADDGSGTTNYVTLYDGDEDIIGGLQHLSGTVQVFQSSDKRLKKFVKPSKIDYAKIIRETVVSEYKIKKSDEFVEAGLIAGQVLEIFPKAVIGRPGEKEEYTKKRAVGEVRVYDKNGKFKVTHKNITKKEVNTKRIKGDFVETKKALMGKRDKMMGVSHTQYIMPLIMNQQSMMKEIEGLREEVKLLKAA